MINKNLCLSVAYPLNKIIINYILLHNVMKCNFVTGYNRFCIEILYTFAIFFKNVYMIHVICTQICTHLKIN